MYTQIGKSCFLTEKYKGKTLDEMLAALSRRDPSVVKELHKQIGSKSKKGKKKSTPKKED